MKDYIDKLREDYHRKQIKKLKFGDKFMAKINDIRYGKISAPEEEVDENNKPIVKPTLPSLNNSTSASTTLNSSLTQYGVQDKYNPKNTATSSVDFGLGPDISGSIGKNSAVDLKPQQKFQNTVSGISDITGAPTNNNMATQAVEKITKDAGIKTYKIADDQVVKDPVVKTEPKKVEEKPKEQQQSEGFFAPPNGDLTTNLYNLGRAIGQKKGTPGRGFGIVGNAGAATLEATRSLLSGVGFSKAQAYTDQFNQEQMIAARKKYESNPQYSNANYTGGPTESRLGGRINHFAEGGEQEMDPRAQQMMAQQQQQQADPRMQQQQMDPRMAQQQQMDPRMQQQQEGQMNEQEAQAYQQIAEKLVNSFETIEEIAEYLKENKVDEIAYKAILQFAEDMMEDRDQSADDNEEATEEPQGAEDTEGSEEGQMRKGGKKFNKKVGEYIEFEYDGKTYKGTIKSIKNGQIFLK